MSNRPCVGCSWIPSPALITPALRDLARYSAEPEEECRITIVSTCIASIFRAVSRRPSPLDVLDPEDEKLRMSAERRFAASSKLVRVRVDASKKRFATVFPRNAGTFFTSRDETSLNDSAVLRTSSISSRESSSTDRRSFRVHLNSPTGNFWASWFVIARSPPPLRFRPSPLNARVRFHFRSWERFFRRNPHV